MRQQIYRWFATHVWLGDAVLAGALALVVVFLDAAGGLRPALGPSLIVGLLPSLPLLLRRSMPEFCLLASIGIELIALLAIDRPGAESASVLLVVYSSVVYAQQRVWGYVALAAGLLGAIAGPLRWLPNADVAQRVIAIALLAALVLVAFVAGDRRRADAEHRRSVLSGLAERAGLIAAQQQQRAESATVAERTQIARELHDIVAHSLAVIVIQADGGAAASAKDPTAAEPVLRTIAETGRAALAEMRALVAVLRTGTGGSGSDDFLPSPGIVGLPALAESTRGTGLQVRLSLPEPTPALPPGIDLTCYRIVQEALTNVLKHAGPAATADVSVQVGESDTLWIDVTDDGRGAAVQPGEAGHGIDGMRERVGVHGGSLLAGPRTGGGFGVRAVIPLPPGTTSAATQESA